MSMVQTTLFAAVAKERRLDHRHRESGAKQFKDGLKKPMMKYKINTAMKLLPPVRAEYTIMLKRAVTDLM